MTWLRWARVGQILSAARAPPNKVSISRFRLPCAVGPQVAEDLALGYLQVQRHPGEPAGGRGRPGHKRMSVRMTLGANLPVALMTSRPPLRHQGPRERIRGTFADDPRPAATASSSAVVRV